MIVDLKTNRSAGIRSDPMPHPDAIAYIGARFRFVGEIRQLLITILSVTGLGNQVEPNQRHGFARVRQYRIILYARTHPHGVWESREFADDVVGNAAGRGHFNFGITCKGFDG